MSLKKGFGTPVIRVFNETGTEVIERVTSFSYLHSEKTDDASRIVIETSNVSIVDHPNLQEGKKIKVVFGLLGASTLRAHVLWIWDSTVTFNELGVRLEIVAYCKAAYMKLNSSKDVFNDTTLEEIGEKIAKNYDLVFKPNPFEIEAFTIGGPIKSTLDYSSPGGPQFLAARDATSLELKFAFKRYATVPQANKSDQKLLSGLADIEPVDNLVVEGRDDDLIIKRRNFNQKPYKTYIYRAEPGYLLEFIPAIKNSDKRKTSVANSVAGWAEETGEYFQGAISQSSSNAKVLGDSLELTIEEQIIKDVGDKENNVAGRPLTVDGLFYEEYKGLDENGKAIYKKIFTPKLDSTKQTFAHITRQGTRPSVFDINTAQNTAAIDVVGRIKTTQVVPVNTKEYLPLVESNPNDAAGAGVNRQSAQQLELLECHATVIGDPALESGKIISILGVGIKHSGNYYIISCEHLINPNEGYRCKLVIAKNALNKVGVEDIHKVQASIIGIDSNNQVGIPTDGTETLLSVPLNKDAG